MEADRKDGKLGFGGKLFAVLTLPQLGVLFLAPWIFLMPAERFFQEAGAYSAILPGLTHFLLSYKALPVMLATPLLAMWCAGVFGFGPLLHRSKLRTGLLFGSFLGVQMVFSMMMIAMLLPFQRL